MSEPDADDIAKALAEQFRKTPNLPLLYAVMQVINRGDSPARSLLRGFLTACDQLTSVGDVAARALSLAPMPPRMKHERFRVGNQVGYVNDLGARVAAEVLAIETGHTLLSWPVGYPPMEAKRRWVRHEEVVT